MKFKIIPICYCLVIALFISSCISETPKSKNQKLVILTTTNIIADCIKNIVGDDAEVQSLMGTGVDPHLYKPSQGDIAKLNNADIIVYNGLHLEGKMTDMLEKLSKTKHVFSVADNLSLTDFIKVGEHSYDPHFWFDLRLWAKGLTNVALKIQSIDTANHGVYQQRLVDYQKEIVKTESLIKAQITKIPSSSRILITAHDAFSYYGRAYNIEVKGLQGISTMSDFGLRDVEMMIDLIVAKKIKSIFVESSISPKSIESIQEGVKAKKHAITIGGSLFSDALGAEETAEGTYLGMLKYNTNTITNALK